MEMENYKLNVFLNITLYLNAIGKLWNHSTHLLYFFISYLKDIFLICFISYSEFYSTNYLSKNQPNNYLRE